MALFSNFLSKKNHSKLKGGKDFSEAVSSENHKEEETSILSDLAEKENDEGDFSIESIYNQTNDDGSSISFDDLINDFIADLRGKIESDFENTKKSLANMKISDPVSVVKKADVSDAKLLLTEEESGNRAQDFAVKNDTAAYHGEDEIREETAENADISEADLSNAFKLPETSLSLDSDKEAADRKEEAGSLKSDELFKSLSDLAEELDLTMLFDDNVSDTDRNVDGKEEKTEADIVANGLSVEALPTAIENPDDVLFKDPVSETKEDEASDGLFEEILAEVFSEEKHSLSDSPFMNDSFKGESIKITDEAITESLKAVDEVISKKEVMDTGKDLSVYEKIDICHADSMEQVNENDPLLKEIGALRLRAISVKRSIEDLEEKARSLEHVVAEKEAVLSHFDSLITERQAELASMETILDDYQKKVIDRESTLAGLEKMIADRKKKIDDFDFYIVKRKADFKSKTEEQMQDVEKSMNSYMEQMRTSFSSFMQGMLSDMTKQMEDSDGDEE